MSVHALEIFFTSLLVVTVGVITASIVSKRAAVAQRRDEQAAIRAE